MDSQHLNNQFSFSSNCNHTMTDTTHKDKSDVQATSLSVKLLNTIGGGSLAANAGKSRITNLKDLSNRIKLANQSFKTTELKRQTIKQELLDQGIDLDKEKLQVAQIKTYIEKREKYVVKEPKEQPFSLEISLKQLPYSQFLLTTERNAAYRAVYESLCINKDNKDSTYKNQTRLKQIKFDNVNRMKNIKEPSSPKPKGKDSAERLKQSRLDMNQLINKFGRCLDSVELNSIDLKLYRQYLNNESTNDKLTSRWLSVMYYQIQMLNKITPANSRITYDKKNMNFINVTSIEGLNQVFSNMYKDKKEAFRNDYFKDHREIKNHIANWFQAYFLLRSDKSTQFLHQLKELDLELGQVFENLLEELNNFKRPQDYLSSIGVNQKTNHFQKILKLIALGKYQNIFNQVSPKIRGLQQAWFILMAISLSRTKQIYEVERARSVKQAFSDYYNHLIHDVLKPPYDLQKIINFVAGLVSLGNYKLLVNLYDQLKEEVNIQTQQIYLDFIHIFIIILANPNLVYCQHKVVQAPEIITKILKEFVNYLFFLKNRKSEFFKSYFRILLRVLTNMSDLNLNLPQQNLVEQICSSLIVRLDDLRLINKQDLQYLKQDNLILKFFQNNMIKNINPQNEQEYIQLAQFCDSINQQHLQESILIKLIIFNYLESQAIKNSIENGLLPNHKPRDNSTSTRNIQIAEDYLEKTMQQGQKDILRFMKTLKKLRNYLLERKIREIRLNLKELTQYRSSFHRVFNYLKKIDEKNRRGLFQVFVSYYDRLNQAYKLINLAGSSLDKYEQEREVLLTQLKYLQSLYPEIANCSNYNKTLRALEN